nr:DNA repair protein RecO [Lachnospiraceae bacterium]
MTEYVKVHGVVLVSTPYKEYDNRIELLTMEYGRITVFIRGARRQGSQSAAASMPFTFAEYELYQGRDAYSFHSANIIRYFDGLAKDFDIMCYASYFSEMARYFSRENVEASAEVNLLYFSFLELEKGVVKSNLIRLIFEYRMLQIQGIGPNVYECVVC